MLDEAHPREVSVAREGCPKQGSGKVGATLGLRRPHPSTLVERLSRGSGAGTSGAAAKVAIACNRETIAPTIARIVALRATIGATVVF